MKQWMLPLVAIFSTLFIPSVTSPSLERTMAVFVADYVRFYSFEHLIIFDNGSGDGRSPKDNNSWVLQTVRLLTTSPGPYVSVLSGSDLLGDGASPRVSLEGATHALFRSGQGGGRGPTNSSAGHQLLDDSYVGLVVHRLVTQEDQLLFQDVFPRMLPTTRWLLLGNRTFPEKLKRVYLPLNSQVTIANFTEEGTRATLWQSYQVTLNLKHNIVQAGHWYASPPHHLPDSAGPADDRRPQSSSDSEKQEEEEATGWVKRTMKFGVLVAATDDPVLRRKDLTGLHLRCTTIHEEPFNVLTRRSDGSVSVSGIFGFIFETLHEATNFTYTCHPVRDNAWGSLVEGRWTGMVGEIHRGVADVAVAALDVTQQRSTVVDFLHGLASVRYVVGMRRPSAGDHMWSAYTKGFELQVWVLVMVSMLVLIVALYVVSRCSVHESRISFADAAFTVFGYICGQGMELQFVSTAGRMVVLTTLLLHTLLLAHYTSDLVSTMTARASAPSLATLYDVYRDPSLTLGFVRDTSINEFFGESSVAFHRELLERIKKNEYEALAGSVAEGMERVLSDPSYLFMTTELVLLHNYGQDCRVYLLPTTYFPTQVSFPVKKNSPFIPIMNQVLMKIWSSGLFNKWWKDHLNSGVSCEEPRGTSMDAKVFLIPFLILSSSILISSLVYFTELCLIRKDCSSCQYQISLPAGVSSMFNRFRGRLSHMSQGKKDKLRPTP